MLAGLRQPPPTCTLLQKPTTSSDSGLNFRRKIQYLKSLNINPSKALHQNPDLRSTPLPHLISLSSTLLSLGLTHPQLGRILDSHPQLLTSDPHSTLYPLLDFLLHQVLIPPPLLPHTLSRCPRLLVSNVEFQLKPTLHFLQQLGFTGPHRITSRTTVLLVSNVDLTLTPKLQYLMALGFAYEEVVEMVLRNPGLLTYSIERNYEPKVRYFFNEMRGELGELKRFPQYFAFSLDGRIKPRHRALVERGMEMRLDQMLKVSDGEFNARLIEMRLRLLEEDDHKRLL